MLPSNRTALHPKLNSMGFWGWKRKERRLEAARSRRASAFPVLSPCLNPIVLGGFLSHTNKANSYLVIAILSSCSSLSQIVTWELLERQIYLWHHPNSILLESYSQRMHLTPEKAVGFSFWYFPKLCVCARACAHAHTCTFVLGFATYVQTHNAYSQDSYRSVYVYIHHIYV